jgi:hypothetical protein
LLTFIQEVLRSALFNGPKKKKKYNRLPRNSSTNCHSARQGEHV